MTTTFVREISLRYRGPKRREAFNPIVSPFEAARFILITLCGYTGEAKQLADKHGIQILNETGLTHLLQSTDAASDPEVLALLRDTRKFCPKCESQMLLRTATKGLWAGKQFWGCSAYPKCRFTMPKD